MSDVTVKTVSGKLYEFDAVLQMTDCSKASGDSMTPEELEEPLSDKCHDNEG